MQHIMKRIDTEIESPRNFFGKTTSTNVSSVVRVKPFTLDVEVIQPSEVDKCTTSCNVDLVSAGMVSTTSANCVKEGNSPGKSKSIMVNLPCRKKYNIRKQCIQAVKTLHDELYIATDRDVLTKTLQMITDIIQYTRKHHPSENGITLKNKSLSPKKSKNKYKLRNVTKLTTRKKKNYFTKRVGTFADSVNAKVIVEETGEITTKRKRSKAPLSQMHGKKQKCGNGKGNENEYNPSDVWVMIGTIKLTHHLKDILLTQMDIRFAWLSDDHIDAVQHLIKEHGTGVGGLNCIATMTHCTRFALPHGENQTIQCHNIGGHWVTSSSITGKVVVYESMTTSLNDSLKRQLVCLYKHLCRDDGSLNISVILQQRQKGSADCGLFSSANAVALANGIDPCTVLWHQDGMRTHLEKCFD